MLIHSSPGEDNNPVQNDCTNCILHHTERNKYMLNNQFNIQLAYVVGLWVSFNCNLKDNGGLLDDRVTCFCAQNAVMTIDPRDMLPRCCYRPPKKLREGTVFSDVCHSVQGVHVTITYDALNSSHRGSQPWPLPSAVQDMLKLVYFQAQTFSKRTVGRDS